MENAKAIELLNKALRCVQTDPMNCGECKKCENYATKEDGIEAIRMAISALEGKDIDVPSKWIPFTAETMPKEDGEYFVLYDDEYAEDYDTGRVGVADFYGDCEAFGYWQEYYDPVSLGFVDSDFIEIKVKKWMPIPEEEGEQHDSVD